MNLVTAEYLWAVLMTGLICPEKVDRDDQYSHMFADGIELPIEIGEKLNIYFSSGDSAYLLDVALDTSRSFRLATEKPENHLVLIAFLLREKLISASEASRLSQVDTSNHSLMSSRALDVVRLAEAVAEEERLGFKAADSDDFLESNLLEFCRSKGIFIV